MPDVQDHLRMTTVRWAQWRYILWLTWQSSGQNNVTLVAAGVAFYAFLAFVPLLAAMFLLFGLVADQAILAKSMETMVTIMPPDAASLVTQQLRDIVEQSSTQKGLRLLLAIVLAIFGAMRAASAIIMALNVAYEVKETRSFVRVNLVSVALTVGLAVVMIAGGVAISIKGSWSERIDGLPFLVEAILRLLVFASAIGAVAAVVATIYRYAPNRPTSRWSWITPGSLFATIGAIVTVLLFALYVAHFSDYTATYGALGAIVVLMMWFWLTSLSLCIGAEINGHLERLFAKESEA